MNRDIIIIYSYMTMLLSLCIQYLCYYVSCNTAGTKICQSLFL